ncbi:hypothetical protein CEXT_120081 [Caerostris extrusa]|uniref:Uncharacterized protein n=1 Tax=Caerostris extrusa TaxID=172846 RepID=A0AAV4RIX7_CAEEX|nr:hypothetical protein CEXT_120081 [Caerostris extrusa]
MRSPCHLKIYWSDPLPAEENNEWYQFMTALTNIDKLNIERKIVEVASRDELHGLLMLRHVAPENQSTANLKIHLERPLAGTVCAVLLLCKVITALKFEVSSLSDSVISLPWFSKEAIDLKTYVQNLLQYKSFNLFSSGNIFRRHRIQQTSYLEVVDPERRLNHKLWWNDSDFLAGIDCPGRVTPISAECETELT